MKIGGSDRIGVRTLRISRVRGEGIRDMGDPVDGSGSANAAHDTLVDGLRVDSDAWDSPGDFDALELEDESDIRERRAIEDRIGEIIAGRYELTDLLGHGGSGAV